MSLVAQLRQAEAQHAAALEHLEALKADPKVKSLKEFEEALRALLGKFGMSLVDVNSLLDPGYRAPKATTGKAPGKHKPRVMKRYTNPHTGESTETLGGLNKVLLEWRDTYTWEVVKTWAKDVE